MNKKLALLVYLARERRWCTSAEIMQALPKELGITKALLGPYLDELCKTGLVGKRPTADRAMQYRSLVGYMPQED